MTSALRTATTVAVMILATLATLATLAAVTAEPALAARGALTQLPGAAGCLDPEADPGCTRVPGFDAAGTMTLTPDGRQLVAGGRRLTLFARDRRTGALRRPRGRAGCFSRTGSGGCAAEPALGDFVEPVVSPDGRHVYTVSSSAGTLVTFARDGRSGALEALPYPDGGCLRDAGAGAGPPDECARARAIAGPSDLAVSSDGRHVYVVGRRSRAVAVFRRDRASGQLTQLPGESGCASSSSEGSSATCARAPLVGTDNLTEEEQAEQGVDSREGADPATVAVTADGRAVFVATPASRVVDGRFAPFLRDPSTGALTPRPGGQPCLTLSCRDQRAVSNPEGLVPAPGGGLHVVQPAPTAADETDLGGAIANFTPGRSPGSFRQAAGPAGCVDLESGAGPRCLETSLTDVADLAVSPDGRNAYYAGGAEGSLRVLARDRRTGGLTLATGPGTCFARRQGRKCAAVRGVLSGPDTVVVSPDGRHVYADDSSTLFAFRRNG